MNRRPDGVVAAGLLRTAALAVSILATGCGRIPVADEPTPPPAATAVAGPVAQPEKFLLRRPKSTADAARAGVVLLCEGANEAQDALRARKTSSATALVVVKDGEADDAAEAEIRTCLEQGAVLFVDDWGGDAARLVRFAPNGRFRELGTTDPPLVGPHALTSLPSAHSAAHNSGDTRIAGVEVDGTLRVIATVQDTLCHSCSCSALPGRLAFGANLIAYAEAVAAKAKSSAPAATVSVRGAALNGTSLHADADFVARPGRRAAVRVELMPLVGPAVASAKFELAAGESRTVPLDAALAAPFDVLDHRIVATLEDDDATLRDVRPLVDLVGVADLRILGADALCAGGPGTVRVLCRNSLSGDPIAGAALSLRLVADDGRELSRAQGVSDAEGTTSLVLAVPVDAPQRAKLTLSARSPLAVDETTQDVTISSRLVAHVFCDLPIHRPGDVLKTRALLVEQPSARPAAGRDVVFELRDRSDVARARAEAKTDAFGVASASMDVPKDFGPADCRVVLVHDRAPVAEAPLRVERFQTPTFRVTLEPASRVVEAGGDLAAVVRAARFDGRPMVGADVSLALERGGHASVTLLRWAGRTDAAGEAHVAVGVPSGVESTWSGRRSDASLVLTACVRDAGGREVRESVPMTASRAADADDDVQVLVPDGPLSPGRPGRVLVKTARAAGATVTIGVDSAASEPRVVDEFGIVEVTVADPKPGLVICVGGESNHVAVEPRPVALALGRRVIAAGGSLSVRVDTTEPTRTAFVDILRDEGVVATFAVPVTSGRGAAELRLPAGVVGPVTIHAYVVVPTSDSRTPLLGDARALLVVPKEELRATVTPSRAETAPGDTVDLDVTVADAAGRAAPAMLAVRVADEAVLSLAASAPECVRAVLVLDHAVRRARLRIGAMSAAAVASLAARRELTPAETRVSDALFAAFDEAVRYRLDASTLPGRLAEYTKRVRARMDAYGTELLPRLVAALVGPGSPAPSAAVKDVVAALRVCEESGSFGRHGILDPWGGPLALDLSCGELIAESSGPDATPGTDDDCTLTFDDDATRGLLVRWLHAHGVVFDPAEHESAFLSRQAGGGGGAGGSAGFGGRGAGGVAKAAPREPPRMRRLFPEALFWIPALETDVDGRARVSLRVPDSLTTWRVDVVASDRQGRSADTTATFRTTQPFAVDLDPPAAMLVGDEVDVPAIVRSSSPKSLCVSVSAEVGAGAARMSPATFSVDVPPGGETSGFVRVRAVAPGVARITVRADADGRADAVERTVTILPAGRAEVRSASLSLAPGGAPLRATLQRAPRTIAGTTRAELRIVASPVAAVLDGVEGMLRKPHGCFEQASSALYPNVLALQYLRRVGRSAPELDARFGDAIDDGVSRLLSFEIEGGGFDWFGRAPAKPLLSAYGLHEWVDIAEVRPSMRAVATRTAAWLASLQKEDGSFPLTDAPYQWVSESKGTTAATAYVTWALARAGGQKAVVTRALEWLRPRLVTETDSYALTLGVAALVEVDAADPAALAAATRLAMRARRIGDALRFDAASGTALHGRRDAASIETTAVAALAAMKLARPDVLPAVPLLAAVARSRLADGTWGTTQATVMALRADLAADPSTFTGATTVTLKSGRRERRVAISDRDRDVASVVDLSDFVIGSSPLDVEASCAGGEVRASLVLRGAVPFGAPDASASSLRLTVKPTKTDAVAGELVGLAVRLETTDRAPAAMPLIEIPLAAGFVADGPSLDALRLFPGVERVEADARSVVIYLRELTAATPFAATLGVRPRLRGRVTAPPASACPYYEPDARTHASTTTFTVR